LFGKEVADHVGPDTLLAEETVHVVFARLVERLGSLDADAFNLVTVIYRTYWVLSISAFYNDELSAFTNLAANGMAFTKSQKFVSFPTIFNSRAEVIGLLRLF
jgi:hypothetical protein